MVAVTTALGLLVGAGVLFGLYSALSFVAHWAAVAGGIGIGLTVLRYLMEERPLEVFENEILDNVLYFVAVLPLGVLSFRFLSGFLEGVSILATVAIGVLAVASVFYPGAVFAVFDVGMTLFEEFAGGE